MWFTEENGIVNTKITGKLLIVEFVYRNNNNEILEILDCISSSQESVLVRLKHLKGFIKLTVLLQEDQAKKKLTKNEPRKLLEMIYFEKNLLCSNYITVEQTWLGFTYSDLEDEEYLDTLKLEDKVRLYSYEAALVFNMSTEIYKDQLKHLNSNEFNCTKYECYHFSLSKISNLILTREKYASLIQNKHTTRYQILMFFITCEIDGKKTSCNDIAKNMQMFENGKYKEFNTASKISDLFDGETNINEEELKFNDETQINSHYSFTKHIKDFIESI